MKLRILLFLLLVSSFSYGATITAVLSADWTNNAAWDCGCQPASGDTIIIPSGIRITVPALVTVDLRGAGDTVINVESGGTLNFNFSAIRIDSADGDVINVAAGALIEALGGIYFDGSFFPSVFLFADTPGPVTIENGTLPVEITNIDAEQLLDGSVELTWMTGSEENFSHFEVEHSYNGEDYVSIDDVMGEGGFELNTVYTYNHPKPLIGHNYYRLKSVDYDGTFEYSKAVHVLNESEEMSVDIYPNPAIEYVNIKLNFVPRNKGAILLFDSNGEIVWQGEIQKYEEQLILPDHLDGGIYMIRIVTPEFSNTSRIIKK